MDQNMSTKTSLYILTDTNEDSDNENENECGCNNQSEPTYYINGKAAYLEMLRRELCGDSASIEEFSQAQDDTKPLVAHARGNKVEFDIDKLIAVLSDTLSLKDLKKCTKACM
jgi:hypothetical protein